MDLAEPIRFILLPATGSGGREPIITNIAVAPHSSGGVLELSALHISWSASKQPAAIACFTSVRSAGCRSIRPPCWFCRRRSRFRRVMYRVQCRFCWIAVCRRTCRFSEQRAPLCPSYTAKNPQSSCCGAGACSSPFPASTTPPAALLPLPATP
jgi:hypothetical protein